MQSSNNSIHSCFVCLDQQGKYSINSHENELLCRECTLHFIREHEPCPICRFQPFDQHTNYNIKLRYQEITDLCQDIIYQFYCQIYPVLETKDKITFTVKDTNNPFKKPVFTVNLDKIYNRNHRDSIIYDILKIFYIYADIHINPKQVQYKESKKLVFLGLINNISNSRYKPLESTIDSTINIKEQVYKLYETIKDDIELQSTPKYKLLKLYYLSNYIHTYKNYQHHMICLPENELNKLTDEQVFKQLQINDILYTNAQYYGLYMNFVKND